MTARDDKPRPVKRFMPDGRLFEGVGQHEERLAHDYEQLERELAETRAKYERLQQSAVGWQERLAKLTPSAVLPTDEALRAIASRHARDAVCPIGSREHPGDPVVMQEKVRAEEVIFYAMKEAFQKFTPSHGGDRERALSEALQLVLDDWANANHIGDDAREQAERALNSPRSATGDTHGMVGIPVEVARLVRKVFLPANPNKLRKADANVVLAAKVFIAAVEALPDRSDSGNHLGEKP